MRRFFLILVFSIYTLFISPNTLLAQQGIISEKSLSSKADYTIRFWNSENGLPQNSITSCLQTKDGFLWMSTTNGLARFDGTTFKIFNTGNTPALPDNTFIKLF